MRNEIKLNINDLTEKFGTALMLKYVRNFCFTPRIYQKDFAKKLGVSVHSVKSWECGRRKPSVEIINKLKEMVR